MQGIASVIVKALIQLLLGWLGDKRAEQVQQDLGWARAENAVLSETNAAAERAQNAKDEVAKNRDLGSILDRL